MIIDIKNRYDNNNELNNIGLDTFADEKLLAENWMSKEDNSTWKNL